jgi:hypothetical protein
MVCTTDNVVKSLPTYCMCIIQVEYSAPIICVFLLLLFPIEYLIDFIENALQFIHETRVIARSQVNSVCVLRLLVYSNSCFFLLYAYKSRKILSCN